VPSAPVDREDGIDPGSYYDNIPHSGVIPNADDDRPMQGPGNGSCAMSITQDTRKRKKRRKPARKRTHKAAILPCKRPLSTDGIQENI